MNPRTIAFSEGEIMGSDALISLIGDKPNQGNGTGPEITKAELDRVRALPRKGRVI